MNDEINVANEILEIYLEKQSYDEKYTNLMFDFTTHAADLVELSAGIYQIEHSIRLNQISLKDYILNSDICLKLAANNITDYTIDELDNYFIKYENENDVDLYRYRLAIDLYRKLDALKNTEDDKINMEMIRMKNILKDIVDIYQKEKREYQELYNTLLNQLKSNYLNTNRIDEKIYNYGVQILNDIFNYYLDGNKDLILEELGGKS